MDPLSGLNHPVADRCPPTSHSQRPVGARSAKSKPPSPARRFHRICSLARLQASLSKVVKGVGGFSHSDWRAFCNDRKKVPSSGFIDGDLIEAFNELPPTTKAEVAAEMGEEMGVDDLTKLVDELSRLH